MQTDRSIGEQKSEEPVLCEHGYTEKNRLPSGFFPCGHDGKGGFTSYPMGDEGGGD